jgi:protein gp37
MENSKIAWTHNTQKFWMGCDKVAPECANCYIAHTLRQQHRDPWGALYKTKTWADPDKWQRQTAPDQCQRIFTCSLSDFFHSEADQWRAAAWQIIRRTPNLIYLILTKRPARILKCLPSDWGEGWQNVWLGVTAGCKRSLPGIDGLRKIPVHRKAVRFLSAEPLLENISTELDLSGISWVIVGGESGGHVPVRLYDPQLSVKQELALQQRRQMELEWATKLLAKANEAKIPFFFKQANHALPGRGEDTLGQVYHEVPPPPFGTWVGSQKKNPPVPRQPKHKPNDLEARITRLESLLGSAPPVDMRNFIERLEALEHRMEALAMAFKK